MTEDKGTQENINPWADTSMLSGETRCADGHQELATMTRRSLRRLEAR